MISDFCDVDRFGKGNFRDSTPSAMSSSVPSANQVTNEFLEAFFKVEEFLEKEVGAGVMEQRAWFQHFHAAMVRFVQP